MGAAPASALTPKKTGPRGHRGWATVLVVLGTLTLFLGTFAVWSSRQLLETSSWVDTSGKLLEDPTIQDALSVYLVDQLYDNVDVQGEIASVLPPKAAILAGPAAGALKQGATQLTGKILASPKVQSGWETANAAAQQAFITIVDGGGPAVSTTGGVVTLNLAYVLNDVGAQIGVPQSLLSKLPPNVASLEIIRSDQLAAVQDAVRLLKQAVTALWILTFLFYGLALWLAGPRRRETLRGIGVGFVVVGVGVLVLRNAAGNLITDSLAASPDAKPAVEATWSIGTSMLSEIAGALVLYGIALFVSAWFAGPTQIATAARRAITPYLRQPAWAYGGGAVLLLLIFWWSPTPATQRLAPSLLLIALILLGIEMLRRRVIKEFPGHTETPDWGAKLRGWGSNISDRMPQRHVPAGGADTAVMPAAAPSIDMSRIEALERLGRLRESGVLSDAELEAEKQKLPA